MDERPGVLVLSDGDVCGLTACAMVREEIAVTPGMGEAWPLVMAFPASDGRSSLRERVVMHQAELQSFRIVPGPVVTPIAGATTVGELECRDLLSAVYAGARQGCRRVVWAVSAARGEDVDLDRIAQITDRALLAGRMAAIDAGVHGVADIEVETPFVDLTDRQLADLAADLNAPLEALWWLGPGYEEPDAPAARGRWVPAFEAVGVSLERAGRVPH